MPKADTLVELRDEPYYLPLGDEVALFEAAYRARLPVHQGMSRTRFGVGVSLAAIDESNVRSLARMLRDAGVTLVEADATEIPENVDVLLLVHPKALGDGTRYMITFPRSAGEAPQSGDRVRLWRQRLLPRCEQPDR